VFEDCNEEYVVPHISFASFAITDFYRAMHFSAFARSWDRMSSVCLSVTLVICSDL